MTGSIEKLFLDLYTNPDFRAANVRRNEREGAEIPKVQIYRDPRAFVEALRSFPKQVPGISPWKSDDEQGIIKEAAERGILIDGVPAMIVDLLKTTNGKVEVGESGFPPTVVVEYPWKEKGRFVHTLDEKDYETVIFSRNGIVISEKAREFLARTRIAIAGASVGSAVSYLLVLSGAKDLRIADGGRVHPHDLNRLFGAGTEDVHVNQAIRLARLLQEVNPFIKVDCHPCNIGSITDQERGLIGVGDFLQDTKFVIEAVDSLQVKGEIRSRARAMGIPVLMATDLGMGAAKFQIELPDSPDFHGRLSDKELALLREGSVDMAAFRALAAKIVGLEFIPDHYLKAVQQAAAEGRGYLPQPGAAAFQAAAMAVTAICMFAEGRELRGEAGVDLQKILTPS